MKTYFIVAMPAYAIGVLDGALDFFGHPVIFGAAAGTLIYTVCALYEHKRGLK